MKNAEALDTFAGQIGIAGLKFDSENTCSLMVDDDLEVFLRGDPEGTILRLNAVIGDLTDSQADPTLLLEVNYSPMETGDGAIAINRMTSEIVYVQPLDVAALDARALMERIESFVKYAQFWTGYLPQMARPASDTLPSSSPDDTEIMIRL